MRHKKLEKLVRHYGKSVDDLITEWYLDKKYSALQIAKKIIDETGICVTARGVEYTLKKLKIGRTRSEARKLGIVEGRVDYSPLRKPIKSIELRRGISLKVRFEIMKRDNFRCVLCGQDAKETKLVIDHIVPVTHGGTNSVVNLRTTCSACNLGKMIYEHEK